MLKTERNPAEAEARRGEYQEELRERIRMSMRVVMEEVLMEEVTALIGAQPYERTAGRADYRNGSYQRDLQSTYGVIEGIEVPRTRKGFTSELFEKYQRRQKELDQGMAQMFVGGASTQGVGKIVETLTGKKPSPSTVSRVFHSLEGEYKTWKDRKLETHYLYAYADGTYFSIIYDDKVEKMPLLAILGVNESGQRELLAFRPGDRENQAAWEDLFGDLKQRGVERIDLCITDGNQSTINAFESKFPDGQRQRCVVHKISNVLGYIPQAKHQTIEPELQAIFYNESKEKSQQQLAAFVDNYQTIYTQAVESLQRDIEACFTFYDFPKLHWRSLRTNNAAERLFEEAKKRSKKMNAAFRNESSCCLLFFASTRSLKFQTFRMPK